MQPPDPAAPPKPDASIFRALGQQLATLKQAGLTHLPRTVPAARSAPPTVPRSSGADVAPAPAAPSSQSTMPTRTLFDAPAAAPSSAAAAPARLLSREERIEQLKLLAGKVAGCTRCAELAATRTQTVFGVGNPQARILFIGEAPGADEDRQGEPFVGKAGQLLNQIIAACRMKREEVYICNILKCRPPGNRTPLPDECAHCREYLDGQLAAIDPEYIVCWGAVAAQNLLATQFPIGRMRKRFFQYGRAKVLCTYHPSYLLRNPASKKDVWEDMQFLFADMGIDLRQKS